MNSSDTGIAAQAGAAIATFRSVGRWLIISFAAAGAMLLAGVQLTSLGSVTGPRLPVAFAALAVALGAVIWAVISLSSLLQPHVSAPGDAIRAADDRGTRLGRFVDEHREVIFPAGVSSARELGRVFAEACDSHARDTPAGRERIRDLRGHLSDIVWWASYEDAEQRFGRVRRNVVAAAAAVAVGAAVYAWAATASPAGPAADPPRAAVPAAPVAVRVTLNAAGRQAFTPALGSACTAAAAARGVPAIALSATAAQTTVVLIPEKGSCPDPVRISVPVSQGLAVPAGRVTPAGQPSTLNHPG